MAVFTAHDRLSAIIFRLFFDDTGDLRMELLGHDIDTDLLSRASPYGLVGAPIDRLCTLDHLILSLFTYTGSSRFV